MKLQEENSVFALGISWPVLNNHINESIIKESWVNPECTCAQNAYHKRIQEARKCNALILIQQRCIYFRSKKAYT